MIIGLQIFSADNYKKLSQPKRNLLIIQISV